MEWSRNDIPSILTAIQDAQECIEALPKLVFAPSRSKLPRHSSHFPLWTAPRGSGKGTKFSSSLPGEVSAALKAAFAGDQVQEVRRTVEMSDLVIAPAPLPPPPGRHGKRPPGMKRGSKGKPPHHTSPRKHIAKGRKKKKKTAPKNGGQSGRGERSRAIVSYDWGEFFVLWSAGLRTVIIYFCLFVLFVCLGSMCCYRGFITSLPNHYFSCVWNYSISGGFRLHEAML